MGYKKHFKRFVEFVKPAKTNRFGSFEAGDRVELPFQIANTFVQNGAAIESPKPKPKVVAPPPMRAPAPRLAPQKKKPEEKTEPAVTKA